MIMHANHWYFRQRKILVCAAGFTWSVLAGVQSGGKEARVATAPPDTATTSFGRRTDGEGPELTCWRCRCSGGLGQEQRKWL